MEAPKKLVTWNIKKTQRFQAKKRKFEAFLNLFENDKSVDSLPMKKPETLTESYKTLKDELKQYIKKPKVDPCFYLTQRGRKAKHNSPENNALNFANVLNPLFTEDLYHLLLRSTIGHNSLYQLGWAKLEEPQNVCKTVLLVIEGFAKSDILDNISHFSDALNIFPDVIEIATPNIPFSVELSTLHKVMDYHIQNVDSYSSMFPKEKEVKLVTAKHVKVPSKLHLLLSPIQLVMENYPLPQNVFQYSKSKNYVFTKELYSPVTKDSPLFAIDCEMCQTEMGRNELTRVAIVNENLDVIYHSLVKPDTKIVNYMTKYSGITEEMLLNVTVKLKDVQKHIQAILPSDAILCGQSLNFDLHALQMIHPYVIDTSIIFNLSGIRAKKDSLKRLTFYHLKEVIQNNKLGHNPIEDSIASMKLVKLKLHNAIQFGDACLGDDSSNNTSGTLDQNSSICNGNSQAKISGNETHDGFFCRLLKFSKTVCLVGNKDSLDKYIPDMLQTNVHKRTKPTVNKIRKATLKYMNDFDFTISHFKFDSAHFGESILELNDVVKEIYDCCVDKTMFMVLISGVNNVKFEDVKSGLFFPVLKKAE